MTSRRKISFVIFSLACLPFAATAAAQSPNKNIIVCNGSATFNGTKNIGGNLFYQGSGGSSSVSFTFTLTSGCTYYVSSDSTWITPSVTEATPNSSGTATVTINVAADNGPGGVRSGNLTAYVNGSPVATQGVNQNSSNCMITITSANPASYPASGGSGSFSFSDNFCFYGGPNSSAGWLQVTTFSSTSIGYSVAANSGGARSATLTFNYPAGQSLTVNQASSIVPLTLNCNPATGPSSVGSFYSAGCTASGGVAPYTWSISSGILPKGLVLSPSGASATVSGTPASAGAYTYTVQVADSSSQSQTQSYQGSVSTLMTMSCSPAAGPASIGTPYTATCTTSGGSAPFVWIVSQGALPAGLSLNPNGATATISGTPTKAGAYQFTVQVTDSSSTQQVKSQSYNGTIGAVTSQLTASPAGLVFSAQAGGTVPQPQSISVFANPGPSPFTAAVSGGSWLAVNPGSGTTPGSVVVSVNPSLVTPGQTYTGSVVISAQNTSPASITIPVTLTVAASQPPLVGVSPAQVQLSFVQGSPASQQGIQIQNAGGGTLTFAASAQPASCGAWLTLTSGTGSATPNSAGTVNFQANSAGLPAGTCFGQITVTNTTAGATQSPVVVPVTMVVTAASQSVVLSQTGMNFVVTQGGTTGAQTFGVLNSGLGSLNWNITSCTLSSTGSCDSSSWLSVSPTAGTSVAGSFPPLTTVSVNPQALSPGQYFATLIVTAPQANNSPKTLVVALTVLPQGEFPPPQAWPGSVILGGVAGGVASNTQSLTLTNFNATPLSYTSTVATLDGSPWLQQTPASGTIPPNSSVQMNIVANLNGLAPGLWYGTVATSFGDGTIQSNPVLLVVDTAVTGDVAEDKLKPDSSSSNPCAGISGSTLYMTFIQPGNPQNFSMPANSQQVIQVQAYCPDQVTPYNGGGASSAATITITVPGLTLPPNYTLSPPAQGNGIWTYTWSTPGPATGVTISGFMFDYTGGTAGGLTGRTQTEGTNATGAVVTPAAGATAVPSVTLVENGAGNDFLTPGQITPGAWVALKGSALFSGPGTVAPSAPYGTTIGNTHVELQGKSLPIYYASPTQVNALIPEEVGTGTQTLIVYNGGVPSQGGDVSVASYEPGIFTTTGSGQGQGSILIAASGLIAGPASSGPDFQPVTRGQYISIYCTGLGAVNGALPADGTPTPGNPLLQTLVTPVVNIGGVDVSPSFSGLAPGYVGLYLVNAQVPTSIPAGITQVSMTVSGFPSNPVTIAVQ
ncbi:MAG: putative Ig domain-containing protein [Bryobacteraceae bacterium]